MTMAFMLIFLVPLAILSALVLVHDLKRRRHPAAAVDAVDVASRVRAVRDSTEAKHGITPGGG
jgi:hypothetical protein